MSAIRQARMPALQGLVTRGVQEEVVRAYFYLLSQTFSVLTTCFTMAHHGLVRQEYFLGSFAHAKSGPPEIKANYSRPSGHNRRVPPMFHGFPIRLGCEIRADSDWQSGPCGRPPQQAGSATCNGQCMDTLRPSGVRQKSSEQDYSAITVKRKPLKRFSWDLKPSYT